MVTNELPPEVERLLVHLRQTGTGKAKIDALRSVALESSTGDQFLAKAATVVPEGTWQKVQKYLLAEHALSPDPQSTEPVISPPTVADMPKESPAVEKAETRRNRR